MFILTVWLFDNIMDELMLIGILNKDQWMDSNPDVFRY